jgi:hypothetical protein
MAAWHFTAELVNVGWLPNIFPVIMISAVELFSNIKTPGTRLFFMSGTSIWNDYTFIRIMRCEESEEQEQKFSKR